MNFTNVTTITSVPVKFKWWVSEFTEVLSPVEVRESYYRFQVRLKCNYSIENFEFLENFSEMKVLIFPSPLNVKYVNRLTDIHSSAVCFRENSYWYSSVCFLFCLCVINHSYSLAFIIYYEMFSYSKEIYSPQSVTNAYNSWTLLVLNTERNFFAFSPSSPIHLSGSFSCTTA